MSTTDSDEERDLSDLSYQSELPSQAPPQKVGRNRVQDLVQDNRELRNIMRETSEKLAFDHSKMQQFYQTIKNKSKEMTAAFSVLQGDLGVLQGDLGERDQTIAFLKAERVQLRQELTAIRLAGMTINDTSQMNGEGDEKFEAEDDEKFKAENDEKFKAEDDEKFKAEYDDTVQALMQQLRKSVDEKKKLQELWEQRHATLVSQWQEWGILLQNDCKHIIEQMQNDHHHQLQSQQSNHEASEQSCKEQVTSLIKEVQGYQLQLMEKEEDVQKWHSQLESNESRIFQLSRDVQNLEEQKKNMTENIISLKQDLEDVQRHRNEKEESLDQLFKVYNEEREKNQKVKGEISRISGERDTTYARYVSAEESLKKKTDEITALKERQRHRSSDVDSETQISVYKQQAEIYKKDFEMEREARLKLHQECESLKTMVGQYNIEMQKLKQELMKYQAQQYQPRN